MLSTLVQGRVCIAAASVSAAKSALTIAVRYGLRRKQFGPPDEDEVAILDYRTHQRRLMPLLAKTYGLHFAQQQLLEKFHAVMSAEEPSDRDRRELESLAAGLKATASWHATATIQTCRECCGGAGYMSVNRFAALKADTDIFTTFEGDNTVLMMLAAKGLLTDYKDQFGDLDPREMVTFVAGQVVETVVERLFARKIVQVISDAVPTRDEHRDLLDREFQLDLFRWREGHITASVAQRFKRGLDEDFDPFEVFRAVQDHAVDAAARAPGHRHPGGVQRGDRGSAGRIAGRRPEPAVRPLRAPEPRERQGLLPGARAPGLTDLQADHARGQPPLQRGPPARR